MVKEKKTNDTSSDTGNTDGAPKKGGKRDKWTVPMLAILIRILLDEKKLGRWAESGWTSESYTKVVVALTAAGHARTAKQVKGCWTRLKGQYKIVKGMLSLSGFGWNPRSKCITATEEVWAAYLDHPKNAGFKDRAFKHFNDMAFLCDDVMATGEDAFSNGLSGGNQDPTSDNGTGAVDDADDGGDEDEGADEDEEDGRGVLGNISVCLLYFSLSLQFRLNLFLSKFLLLCLQHSKAQGLQQPRQC
ncbi:Myb/SANT-like DNA-binding domain-containing protein [Mycena galopus ATCC 62051]|nr:Myb/SANT-like DNA-binding domain-containing protein [Mycena galopus ATCC 62051]